MAQRKPLPKILGDEFNYEKNTIKFEDLRNNTRDEVWWKCKNGHEFFLSPVSRRTKDKNGKLKIRGCKFCKKEKGIWSPPKQLVDEFDKTKNSIDLKSLPISGKEKYWWKCSKGHEFYMTIRNRFISSKKGKRLSREKWEIKKCHICRGKSIREGKVVFKLPNIILEAFDKDLNPDININNLARNSKEIIKWKCKKDSSHIWKTQFKSRLVKKPWMKKHQLSECPYCKTYKNTLKELYPNIFNNFIDTEKTKDIDFDIITPQSSKKVWVKCNKSELHSYEASIANLTRHNKPSHKIEKNRLKFDENFKCAFCLGFRIAKDNSFAYKFPELLKYLDKSKNKDFDPNKYPPYSRVEVWWTCPKNKNHLHKSAIGSKVHTYVNKKEYSCSYCNAPNRLHKDDSIGFLYPDIAKEFSLQRNPNKNIYEISPGSQQKYWWQCSKNKDHFFKLSPSKRVSRNYGCPLCSERIRRWTKNSIITFLNSINDHIEKLTSAEIYLIFQQTGLPNENTQANKFIKDYVNGNLPKDEIEKFKEDKKSKLDKYFEKEDI